MRYGLQSFFQDVGKAACYALNIIDAAGEILGHSVSDAGAVSLLENCIARGFIHYNEKDQDDPNNFFVKDASAMLTYLVGTKWDIRHALPGYQPQEGEIIVAERWERKTTSGTISHFKRPLWDSLVGSLTVANGQIVSLRVARIRGSIS